MLIPKNPDEERGRSWHGRLLTYHAETECGSRLELAMRVVFRDFRGVFKTWKVLFQEASDFATEVGRDNLVSISHSSDQSQGIITVWYWGNPDACHKCGYDLTGNTSGVCPECGARIWSAES